MSTLASISTLASHNHLNGQILRKQYKEIFSDLRIRSEERRVGKEC